MVLRSHIIGVVSSEASPRIQTLDSEVLLVLVVDPVLVEMQHDDVADDGGDGEKSQARPQVQEQRDEAKLPRLSVNIDNEVDAVCLVKCPPVLPVILRPPVV